MTNDVCCSFAWFSSQSALLPLHNALLWYMTTLHSRLQRIHTVRKSQSAASTKPMEFGMWIFQSSRNTKQCTHCLEIVIWKTHFLLTNIQWFLAFFWSFLYIFVPFCTFCTFLYLFGPIWTFLYLFITFWNILELSGPF